RLAGAGVLGGMATWLGSGHSGPPIQEVLTAETVSAALGQPAVANVRSSGANTPVQIMEFETPQGKDLLMVTLASQLPAALTSLMERRGTALPGIGDQAFIAEEGGMVRVGDHMVGL